MPGEKQHTEKATKSPSPDERHREFSEENGRWSDRVEESLSELDELAGEPDSSDSPKTERTPA
jgi:hypothetical protein